MKFYSEKLSPRRLSLQWRLTLLISGLVITACALMYQVYANNRTGLLVDLSKIFTERKIDMRSINSRTSKQEKATISISFEIGSKEELSSLVAKIRQVESVIDVERTTG